MSIDPVQILESRVPTFAESEVESGRSEFPSVLRSTLDSKENTDRSSGLESRTNEERVDRQSAEVTNSQTKAEGSASEERTATESRAGEHEAAADDESEESSSTDEAALGVATTALIGQARAEGATEAAVANEGRISALETEESSRELAQRDLALASKDGLAQRAGEESTGDAISTQNGVAGTLGDELATGTTEPSAVHAAEAIPNPTGLALAEDEQAVASSQRSEADAQAAAAAAAQDLQDESQQDSEARSGTGGNEGHASEQGLYDQASQGAASSGVDPNRGSATENAASSQQGASQVSIDGVGALNAPTAGALTETTPAPTPGVPTPLAASDAIAVQTEWLASRGGGTARLLLSPPSLGEIAIRVSLQAGVVNVVIVAQEALAQSVAEDQSDRLSQAFASRELRLESLDVRRGDPQDLASGDLGQFAESGAHQDERTEDEQRAGADSYDKNSAMNVGSDNVEGTISPEFLSVGREAGVDLRI